LLEKRWAIIEVEGKSLKGLKFMKSDPYLEFKLKEGRVIGSEGCNNLSGSFRCRAGQLNIGQLGRTLMACPDMETSNRIYDVLSGKTFAYAIRENTLVLDSEGKTRMILELK
jgi:heat shock protein HslJ